MKIITQYINVIDKVSDWTGRVFSWVVVLLVLITVMEVILRRFFNCPTTWSFEVLKQLFGLYFMIVAAYGLLHHAHVSIDLFTMNLARKKHAILDIIVYVLFFFPFVIVCIKESFLFAMKSWAIREVSWSVFAPPLYPIKTVIVIAFLLLLLQGISEFSKRVLVLKGVEYES